MASGYQKTAQKALTFKERWRIPIIYNRVKNGKLLNAADARVWSTVKQNMRKMDIMSRIVSAMSAPMANDAVTDDAYRSSRSSAHHVPKHNVKPKLREHTKSHSRVKRFHRDHPESPSHQPAIESFHSEQDSSEVVYESGDYRRYFADATTDGTTVLYEGTKFFWRDKATLDILLIQHDGFDNIIEAIVYCSRIDREAPRLYILRDQLQSRIDVHLIEEKVRATKEKITRRHENANSDEIRHDILENLLLDYIVDHLSIKELDMETKAFEVEIQQQSSATEEDADSLLCSKPLEMKRFLADHYSSVL